MTVAEFCEGDCSCGHDHERLGPEVPGCIECSCGRKRDERRAMDELTSLTEDMGLYEKD